MADGVTTQITQPPDFLIPYYEALAKRGMEMGNLGFTPYDGQRVAGWNDQMTAAGQMIQNRALAGSGINDAAKNWFMNTMNGQNAVNPIANSGQINPVNPTLGAQGIQSGGQVQGVQPMFGPGAISSSVQSQLGTNPYSGSNPYLNNAISQAQNDVTGRIDSKFNNNAFGGTAHQQTLARELGNVSNSMRMQDYTQQQGLAENQLNRSLSNQQYNINNTNDINKFNAGIGFQNAGIGNQAQQFNSGVSAQNVNNQNQLNQFNAGLQNNNAAMMNSMNQFNAGLQGQNIANQNNINQFNAGLQNQNRNFQSNAMGFYPGLANVDYQDAQQLMNLGLGLQGTNQQIADANYSEFLRQQNYPSQQLSWMQAGLNPMAQAFSNQTMTYPQQKANPWATAAGVAGTVGGMGNMFGWW